MKKGICLKIVWLSLLCVFLLAGCSKDDSRNTKSDSNSENRVNDNPVQDEGNSENESLWVKASETILFEEPEDGYQQNMVFYATFGNKIYLMRTEYPEAEGAERLCVQIYDSDTKEMEKNIFTLEIPEHEGWYTVSMDLTTKQELSIKLAAQQGEKGYCLVRTDLQGRVLEVEETFPNAEDYPWNQDYLSLTHVFPLTDGRVILSHLDNENQTSVLTWFDEESGVQKPLGTLEAEFLNAVCCDEEGILYYYTSDGSIVRWDVEKDEKVELISRLYQDGIMITNTAGLIWNTKGELLLCDLGRNSSMLYVLTSEEPVSDEELRLACVQEPIGEEYLQKMAAIFSRENDEIPIVMEGLNESDYDDYRNRIFTELVEGKGPEMMLVSYEDMEYLQEKGILCDLTDLISEDVRSQLISSMIELGTVNGQLAGITPEIAFNTVLTANATWEADSWSLSEFTELLEGREHWDWPVNYLSNKVDYYTLFWMIFCKDLSHSPFVDLEQGICHFDSEEFIEILELCQKYGQSDLSPRDFEERVHMLKEGESLASVNYLFNGLKDFSDMMSTYGEDCHIVGFPGDKGSASYIMNYSQGYLVVNANAVHKEEIKDFINYLLSYENQYEVNGTSVRMDVIMDSVVFMGGKPYMRTAAGPDAPILDIAGKPDGTSYLEEYLSFIENCKPEPRRLSQVSEIIGDELVNCFEGGKSVEDTADVIQHRVQLYLDEAMQ